MLPRQPNESLIDGLACLQAVASSANPLGVREAARILGLEPTRVHRLLKTLSHLGIASQTPDKKYVPGPAMHVLAAQSIFASGLIRKALPHLESLQQYGMLVAYGVLWKDNVSYFYHGQPGMPVEQALGRVGLHPASTSSVGHALLSFCKDADIKNFYRGKEIPGYPDGINSLLKKICEARKQGFSVIFTPKANTTMAVPVGNPPHSAIAFSGKISPSEVQKYYRILKETAEKIESA
ncbi:MAG TPA: transcriptional regulator [Lentisphaeria bacterium]|nr:MAG: hypothetical protein A2X48_10765 [Lentisphaerae bacterium GWF2_49_21]HBC86608.1 transcriptional regulator [Lentisphaeria bacterium]